MNLIGLEILHVLQNKSIPCFPAFYGFIWVQLEELDDSKTEKVHTGVEAECNKFYCSFFFSFP